MSTIKTYQEFITEQSSSEYQAAEEIYDNLFSGAVKSNVKDVQKFIKDVMKEYGAKDYDKVVKRIRKLGYTGKIEESSTMNEESVASIVKRKISQYSLKWDADDVAKDIGKKEGWSEKQILSAENIIRKKYIK